MTNSSSVVKRSWNARAALAGAASLALAGCASTQIDRNFSDVQQQGRESLGADVKWLTTDDARRQAQVDVDGLLAQPLDGDGAVRIALAYSPALQAMLYDAAATSVSATQSARLPNPVFAFERWPETSAACRSSRSRAA